MKNSILKITLCLSFILLFTSCNTDDDNEGGSPVIGNTFLTAKVNGVNFEASEEVIFVAFGGALSDQSGIVGTNEDGYEISFILPNPLTEGTIDRSTMDTEFITVLSYSESPNNARWGVSNDDNRETPFTITISNIDENFVEGTFSFVGTNIEDNTTIEVTEGQFKAEKL